MPGSSPRTALLSALLLGLQACAGDDVASPAGGELTDSAGVEILVNNRSAAWTPEESWFVEEVATYGVPADRPEATLGTVVAGALSADGAAFALDASDGRVRVFGPEGELQGLLGTEGEGPGELGGGQTSVVWVAGDAASAGPEGPAQVWVPDPDQRRVVRWTTDGRPLPDLSLDPENSKGSWWQTGGDGQVYLRSVDWTQREDGTWQGRDGLSRAVLRGDGVETEPVATFAYDRPDLEQTGQDFTLPPVLNAPAWTVAPDGTLAWLTLDVPELELRTPDGRVRLVRSESWVARTPSGGDEELLRRMTGEGLRDRGAWKGSLDGVEFDFPETLPALTDVFAGPEGTLWVQRGGALREVHPMVMNNEALPPGWSGQVWDVLDRDGVYLGSVEFPPRFRLLDARGDRLLGARYDLNYVDRLVVLEIRRPGSEG